MAKKLTVEFIGDTSNLEKAFGKAESKTSKFGGAASKAGKAAALGLAGGIAAGGAALLSFGKAAADAEKSQAAMEAQLKTLGISYDKNAGKIDKVIQSTAKLAAVDDEDLQAAFTNIVRITGDVDKALDQVGLAADFARGKNIDLAKAGELIGKVAGGNTGILSKYGITIEKGASATEALGILQKKFGGQAEAYGKTAAGAQDKFKNATENLQEALGAKLLPVFTKVVGGVAKFVEGMESGTGAGGKFRKAVEDVFGAVKGAVDVSVKAIRGFLDKHEDDINSAGDAVRNLAKAVEWAFEKVILPVISKVIGIIGPLVEGAFNHIGLVVKTLSGILTGDFGKAWDGVKGIFSNAAKALVGVMDNLTQPFRDAIGDAMGAIAGGIKTAGGNLFEAAKTRVAGVVSGVRSIVDDMTQAGKSFISHIGQGIAEAGTNLFEAAKSRVAGVVSGVRSIVDDVLQAGKSIVAAVGSGIAQAGTNLFDAAVDKAGSILSGFRSIIEKAKDIGGRIVSAIASGIAGAGGFAKAAANKVIDLLNSAIPDKIKGPGPLPDINLPDNPIPRFARGGVMARTGLALVGEEGPELARLPGGTRVYPAGQTARMMSGGGGGPVVNIEHAAIGSSIDLQSFGASLAYRLQLSPG